MNCKVLKKPHYFTCKQDEIILNLFHIIDTGKLSVLMGIETIKIVKRNEYLHDKNN
jgi:hypothetical protein